MESGELRFSRQRRVPMLWLAVLIVWVGCSAPDSPPPEQAPNQLRRREEIREQLRVRLGERYDVPLPVGTLEQVRNGARLYDRLCRSCHGATARGDGRSAAWLTVQPSNLRDPLTASFFSDQAKLTIIAEGIDGTPMIGWGNILGDRDQTDVLLFMKTLIRERQSQ